MADQDVTIVGGGLVGSLLSCQLVDRGHRVTVYEGRSDIRGAAAAAGRSINLVLTRRGIRALALVGLDREALELTVPVTGRMMHSLEGALTYQPYGRDRSECNYSISRGGLNRFLVTRAAERGVEFRFDHRLVGLDVDTSRLTFERTSDGKQVEVAAGIIFGTDGAGSVVRQSMREAGLLEDSVAWIDHGYKELLLSADADGGFSIEKNALHIWPRGGFMLMALPNLDGSFTLTLYLPLEGDAETPGFDGLTDAAAVEKLFAEQFADILPMLPNVADEFFENPTGKLGTVRCSPWNAGHRVQLLGDAAHAIVPFFGQGMNSGFEDCRVLADLMGSGADGFPFPEFSRNRKPATDAIADMALDNFVEMRDRVADADFLLRKQVEHRLEQERPEVYRSRYSMVMYSHIPFDVAQQAGRIQQSILDELCADLGSAADVDLDRAEALARERLHPFLDGHGVDLDY